MNNQLKKRIIIASIVIIAVIVALVFFLGQGSTAQTVTVAQAQSSEYADKKIQVEGTVVDNSYTMNGSTVTFSIYDPNDLSASPLIISYDGAVSATFGNGVTAICTGKMNSSGILVASELVTKCPSKYESSTDALSIQKLLDYGEAIYGKPVKVVGTIASGTLKVSGDTKIFTLAESSSTSTLNVSFQGALGDNINEGKKVVVTGALGSDGTFAATEISLEG